MTHMPVTCLPVTGLPHALSFRTGFAVGGRIGENRGYWAVLSKIDAAEKIGKLAPPVGILPAPGMFPQESPESPQNR